MEESLLKQILEIYLSVTVLGVIVIYGVRMFNKIIDKHHEERLAKDKEHKEVIVALDQKHREERAEKDKTIRDQEEFIRSLTRDTYEVMTQLTTKFDAIGVRTKSEKEELKALIADAKSQANEAVISKLEIIGQKLGIDDVRFFR